MAPVFSGGRLDGSPLASQTDCHSNSPSAQLRKLLSVQTHFPFGTEALTFSMHFEAQIVLAPELQFDI